MTDRIRSLNMFIVLAILVQVAVCLPAIPATYVYHSGKDVNNGGEILYIGTTNNLARRFKEHVQAGHSYANSQMSYWDMSGSAIEQRYNHERDMIAKYKPKFNKSAGGNGPRVKSGSIQNLFDSDFPGLSISTREMIGGAIALYYEYTEITEMFHRHESFINEISREYDHIYSSSMRTLEKISAFKNELHRHKLALDSAIEKGSDFSVIDNLLKNSVYNRKMHTDLIAEVSQHKETIHVLKNKIQAQADAEKQFAVASVVGTLWLNFIIPGFTLIEKIATAGTAIKLISVLNFVNRCEAYLTNLGALETLLSSFI